MTRYSRYCSVEFMQVIVWQSQNNKNACPETVFQQPGRELQQELIPEQYDIL